MAGLAAGLVKGIRRLSAPPSTADRIKPQRRGAPFIAATFLTKLIKPVGKRISLGRAPIAFERGVFYAAMKMMSPPSARMKKVENVLIPAEGRNVTVRIYRPDDAPSMPVILYFHGGGFRFGALSDFDGFASNLAAKSGAVVVSVDYRLAPENPYPAARNDAYETLEWVHSNAAELGVDPNRIAVVGDSAGANLAAVVALMARDRNGPPIIYQLLFCPVTVFLDFRHDSSLRNDGILLSRDMIATLRAGYAPHRSNWRDPYLSPFLAGDHSKLPPAFVVVADHDPLHDDGIGYFHKLENAGVPAKLHIARGAVHDFVLFRGRQSGAVISRAAQTLKEAFQQGMPAPQSLEKAAPPKGLLRTLAEGLFSSLNLHFD